LNEQIGRIDAAIVIDSTEERLRRKLLQRDPHHSRPDDTTLAIENRLKIFKTETLPVVEYFDNKGLLTVVSLLFDCFVLVIFSHSVYLLLCSAAQKICFFLLLKSFFFLKIISLSDSLFNEKGDFC